MNLTPYTQIQLNPNFLRTASHLTGEWCRTNQKLILACDMDETLLTETEGRRQLVLRPRILYMLRKLQQFYELCLVTYSTRDRTEDILRLKLDPDGRLFNGRVLCREDILAGFANKREAFFAHLPQNMTNKGLVKTKRLKPHAWSYVVILDDFPTAWSNFTTCIPIRPFVVSSLVNAAGSYGIKHSPGERGYIMCVYKFFVKLHSMVFQGVRTKEENAIRVKGEKILQPQTGRRNNSVTAFSTLFSLKRQINSAQRFLNMCYVDPGQLFSTEANRPSVEKVPKSPLRQPDFNANSNLGRGEA
nr:RNA polymerase II subunit A C terminal domain [Hymenolepis microstoma]